MFVGRQTEFGRVQRSASEVAAGKFDAIFLVGEYGIGKTSLAQYCAQWARVELKLFPIHVMLGGVADLEQLSEATIKTLSRTEAFDQTAGEKIRNMLAKYVGDQEFFGFRLNLSVLRPDLSNISKGFGEFLRGVNLRMAESGYQGLFLIFDEINGIAKEPAFAHLLKTLVDESAISPKPFPWLLMLCGTEQIRQEIISHHKPVERIFRLADVKPLAPDECVVFFERAYESVGMSIAHDAAERMAKFSGGLPKLVQVIGEEVYYACESQTIALQDAVNGIFNAADEIGRKIINPTVYGAIRSESYRKILKAIPMLWIDKSLEETEFDKNELAALIDDSERKRLNNFLQKMKEIGVLVSGEIDGRYYFSDRLTLLYVVMRESSSL